VKGQLRLLWHEWVLPALLALTILAPLRSTLADWNDVPSGSMMPTILVGDRIVVNKLAYDLKIPFTTWHLATWADPQRGDIVVFRSPVDDKRLVKRIVALPGDRIELREDHLFINQEPATYTRVDASTPTAMIVNESVADRTHPLMIEPERPARRSFGPVEVPAGSYFVMGDNRDNSYDSRYFGFLSRDRILGRATFVAMSFDHDRYFTPRLSRFGQRLP